MMMTSTDSAHAYLALPWHWNVVFSADDAAWIVTIDELPDFLAAGATSAEAVINSREALVSHILGYLNSGTRIPLPATLARQQIDRTASAPSTTELVEV